MVKREFIILAKKDCPYCRKVEDLFKKHDELEAHFYYANVDFQNQEFKDDFGEDATYPRVYERLSNGKKKFFGDSSKTIEKLEKGSSKSKGKQT